MSAIGSLLFCTDCGSLLDSAGTERNAILDCDLCGAKNKDISQKAIVTRSKEATFPSALRSKLSNVQTIADTGIQTMATIRAHCDKCGRDEVRWYEQQLRSADEGSTIFYQCDCGNKWSQNN